MADPTDDTTTTPGPLDGYEATDQDGEGVQPLGQSGWLTVTIAGTAYRLRNPLFGELKKLRLALEAVTDEIETVNMDTQRKADELLAAGRAVVGKSEEEITAAQRRKIDKLSAEAKKAGRHLVNLADDRRMGWWTQVFDTLSVDGTPPDWPSWVVDINLPGKVMEHWRSVPLAPGR